MFSLLVEPVPPADSAGCGKRKKARSWLFHFKIEGDYNFSRGNLFQFWSFSASWRIRTSFWPTFDFLLLTFDFLGCQFSWHFCHVVWCLSVIWWGRKIVEMTLLLFDPPAGGENYNLFSAVLLHALTTFAWSKNNVLTVRSADWRRELHQFCILTFEFWIFIGLYCDT